MYAKHVLSSYVCIGNTNPHEVLYSPYNYIRYTPYKLHSRNLDWRFFFFYHYQNDLFHYTFDIKHINSLDMSDIFDLHTYKIHSMDYIPTAQLCLLQNKYYMQTYHNLCMRHTYFAHLR